MVNRPDKYEVTLLELEEKYKTVFENSAEGIILVDENGKVTEWNKFMETKTGLSKDVAIGQNLWDLQREMMTEEWKKIYAVEKLKKIWMDIINSYPENKIVTKEGQYYGNDGELVLTEDLVCPVILRGKKSLFIIQRDLTARRKAELALKDEEQKLKLLNATKDKLFSIIAHDLRSPLQSILGFSELLEKNIKEGAVVESEKCLEIITLSIKNTFNLLDNLLVWAKTQTGQINFNPVYAPLLPIVTEIIDLLSSSAKLKGISVQNFTSDNIRIFADNNMLRIILQNLISNAIKYTNSGGNIRINTIQHTDNIEIVVSDDGTGMRQSTIDSLFTLNTNISLEGTASEKGSGLGLVICKEFVEKHGGYLLVDSEYGKGSYFSLFFPVYEEHGKKTVTPLRKTETTNKLLKVLIADDEYHSRTVLEMLIKKYSREILFANNGVKAIECCQENPDTDLILMDNNMPELNGYEAIKEIRRFNKNVIVIGLSAYLSQEEKEKMIGAGCNDFMLKPLQSLLLVDLIKKYFDK
jgi:PAS domain S-box-containing protein